MLDKMSFQDLITWCCVTEESLLRKEIKHHLTRHQFFYLEDDYRSYRSSGKEDSKLCNLLLARGNSKYCLVAHTDVCRDHDAFDSKSDKPIPNPVIKYLDGKKILQDKNCKVQLGGDDRLGVAIAVWIAIHTDAPLSILFTTDEEVGLLSASKVKFPELKNYHLLIQIDRGNHTNQLVNNIKGLEICSSDTLQPLLSRLKMQNMSREVVSGSGTDVFQIKKNGMCQNAINMTCGYHESRSSSGEEYIDLEEAEQTVKTIMAFLEF